MRQLAEIQMLQNPFRSPQRVEPVAWQIDVPRRSGSVEIRQGDSDALRLIGTQLDRVSPFKKAA